MWSNIVLLGVLVGCVFAASNPGWRSNTEYVYQIDARTLSGFYEFSNDYSGLVIRGKLKITPKTDELLYARITEPQYGSVHGKFNDPFEYIPEQKLDYKPLQLSGKTFQIVMRDGLVVDLVVSKDVPDWEVNIIKGIVSQIQLDTKAKNVIHSEYDTLPEEDEYSAEFKTLESTVTGVAETMYNIYEFPEYILQTKPWHAPLPHLKGNGKLMEIVKTKNYTNSRDRPMYHFGWDGLGQIKPGSNQMGDILSRSSNSHAIISGTWKRYTVQHSHTTNLIVVSPTLYDKQKAAVFSTVNITLESVQSGSGSWEEVADPINLGTLVYSYKHQHEGGQGYGRGQYQQRNGRTLRTRSLDDNDMYYRQGMRQESYENFKDSVEEYYGDELEMRIPHKSLLLPYTMGYFGKDLSTSGQYDVVQKVTQLAHEIAQELRQVEEITEKDTATKFVILTTLIRSMSQEEIQSVASNLYRGDNQGRNNVAWEVYRDAVAESGTGPAFLAIEDWILTKKIESFEAADVIATMTTAVRQPTVEYMKKYFELIKHPEVKEQYELNNTAVLFFSTLAHKVYVHVKESHDMYPVHTYGKFRTEEGKRFLKEEVIPYMKQELKKAIQDADSVKIQVYIRALGHIGHQKILEVFEPYLEGKKQASQFQRFMMVVCLDNLVESQPKLARSVLYKIYQNRGETQEMRVAAVYQLMRTSPSADMLQQMAVATNFDFNEQVNAAVQSAIKTASKLIGDEFINLRHAAESAKPLLTKKEYGLHYSKDYLHSYIVDQMQFVYKQVVQTFNDGTSYLPKGGEYSLHANVGGYKEHRLIFASYVSSVDSLVHEWDRKFKTHQDNERQSQQQSGQDNVSVRLARLLNMEVEELEQLEGNIHIKAGEFHTFFAYSNETFYKVPGWIKKLEDTLRSGKQFRYNKIVNQEEKAIAYPVEMGVPFIFTYDLPTIAIFEGQVQGSANPQMASEDGLTIPDSIETTWEIDATFVRKVRGKIGFMAPWTQVLYSAGYDKNVQIRIPLRGKVLADIKEDQLKFEFEPKQPQTRYKVFHYSSIPYVASSDIMSVEPTSLRQTTQKLCDESKLHRTEFTWGKKSTGMPFWFSSETSQKLNFGNLYKKFHKRDDIYGMFSYGLDENVECNKINVIYAGDRATSQKMKIHLGYKKQYITEAQQHQQQNRHSYGDINQLSQTSHEPQARQQDFINKVSANINNAHVRVFDASVEFPGSENVKYIATAAYAWSGVDPKSRALVYYQGHYDSRPQQFAFAANNYFPNTNGLDMEYAMEFDPTSKIQIEAAYGENFQSSTKMRGSLELRKSGARKNYLKNSPMYHVCRQQMTKGNYQQHACANMTQEANLLDHFKAQIQYEQVTPMVWDIVHNIFQGIKYMNYYYVHHEHSDGNTGVPEGQWKIEGRFRPDLRTLNVTLKTEKDIVSIYDRPINHWFKNILVVHPTFDLKTRLMGKALALKTYRPICSIGKDWIVTFDNVSYPFDQQLTGNPSYVMFQYVKPTGRYHFENQQIESTEDHIKHQLEKHTVFVRPSTTGHGKKDVKMIVTSPYTQYHEVQIKLKPHGGQQSGYSGSNPSAKVIVDGQETHYNDQRSTDFFDGYIQIYALPNGEVKVQIGKYYYIIYDGMNVKATVMKGKMRGALRGLCGNFNGEKGDDIQSPKGCILKSKKDFLSSWAFTNSGSNQEIDQARARSERPDRCIYKNVLYSNVISDRDAGRHAGYGDGGSRGGECATRRTHYVIEGNTICFTIQPIKVCNPGCQRGETTSMDLPVHCVQKSNVANLWRQQIDQGSSPDFSRKAPTKSIRIEVPVVCRQ